MPLDDDVDMDDAYGAAPEIGCRISGLSVGKVPHAGVFSPFGFALDLKARAPRGTLCLAYWFPGLGLVMTGEW